MKVALTLGLGFLLGIGISTLYWGYQFMVPFNEQEIRALEGEAELMGIYAKRLQEGDVDAVISFLQEEAKSKSEMARLLTDGQDQ